MANEQGSALDADHIALLCLIALSLHIAAALIAGLRSHSNMLTLNAAQTAVEHNLQSSGGIRCQAYNRCLKEGRNALRTCS